MGENLTVEKKPGKRAATDVKLYDLPQEFEQVWEMLVESEGEFTPEIEAALGAVNELLVQKSESYVAVIRRFDRQAESAKAVAKSLKAEMDDHSKNAKIRENCAKRLKERLMQAMIACGKVKLDGQIFPVALRDNPRPLFKWTGDPYDIPAQYQKVIPPELDDAALMATFNATLRPALKRLDVLHNQESHTPEEEAELDDLMTLVQTAYPEGLVWEIGQHLRY